MTLIEVHETDDERSVKKMIGDAYTALYNESPPAVRFGRTVVWQGRRFQLLEFGADSEGVQNEERVFRCWMLERARMQIGSVQGFVFTTPPEDGAELAGRVKGGGRCGREYKVVPLEFLELASNKSGRKCSPSRSTTA